MKKRTQSENLKQDKKTLNTKIPHNTCTVFVSIYCISKYLQYFHVFFRGILIIAQLRIEILFFSEDVFYKSSALDITIQNPILHGFSVICILDTSMTTMRSLWHLKVCSQNCSFERFVVKVDLMRIIFIKKR